MKQRKNSKSFIQRLPKWALLLLVLLILAGVGYAIFGRNSNGQPRNGYTPAEAQAQAQAKKQFVESGGSKTDQSNSSNNSASGPAVSNTGTKITDLSARQETDGTVTVFTKLASNTSGQCQLTIKNGSNSLSRTADIIYQTEFSTCAGFSIPISQLGSGNWNISLAADDSTKQITFGVNQ